MPIPSDLSATLLYAIESDLAGAAGMPTELDNMALSSLTLSADMHRLYQMRYVDLPQNYYFSYAAGLSSAIYYDKAMIAHIDEIDSLEKPAVIADFLMRFEKVTWCLVSGVHGNRMILSLRTSDKEHSAGEIMRRLVRKIGEGGGHRTKAGGFVALENGSAAEIQRRSDDAETPAAASAGDSNVPRATAGAGERMTKPKGHEGTLRRAQLTTASWFLILHVGFVLFIGHSICSSFGSIR